MKLLSPIMIGNVEIRNRVVMPSMTNCYTKNGFVTEQMLDFYEARAAGGVGMICVEDGIVDFPGGNNAQDPVSVDDDKYIPMLSKLVDVIKKHGCVAAIQLSHAGRRAGRIGHSGKMDVTRGIMPVGPSMIGHPFPGYVVPRELEVAEIEEIIDRFGQGARRCVEAGFEVIGLHCAHMYLCGEFLSPWANKRKDKYGGSLENRMRFVLEIIERMKKELGDIPLICRMNGAEPEGGNTPEEIREIAHRLELCGVKAISVSTGFGPVLKERNIISTEAPSGTPEGVIVPLAENVKASVSIPVMAGNMIRNPEYAEKIINENRCDMITLGRPLITDPEWVNKVIAGKYKEIRPCVSCCQGCIGSGMKGLPVTCIMNPIAGKEGDPEMQPVPALKVKKVLIIGSGPAGLESAITAADRGHEVTIWEKGRTIGGTVILAEKPPRKEELSKIINYFGNCVSNSAIKVEYGVEATPERIKEFCPDVVIVAIGGKSFVPPIKGIEKDNVHLALDVLQNDDFTTKSTVIIGGGQVGVELAEHLAERGTEVTIVEMLPAVAGDMFPAVKQPLMFQLEGYNVRILTNTYAKEIKSDGLLIERNDSEEFIPADAVIISTGVRPQNELANLIKAFVPEVYNIGDCEKPGNIMSAVHTAYKIGLNI